jgi:acetyl-CoA synthetase
MYRDSVRNPDRFWGKHGKRIDWFKPYTKVKNTSFKGKVSIKWFEDGQTNVSYNCIDRHLKKRANQTAIIWEGDNPYDDKKVTYGELYEQVCRLANVLKSHGVRKGDRVTIYMPMIPEAAYAMLACARIGAIHSVVFGGFSPDALAGRIVDCESTFVITADEGLRGGKPVPLKENTDKAIDLSPAARAGQDGAGRAPHRRQGGLGPGRDLWYHEETAKVKPECKPEKMKAEDPLFILYTSGSTGKPKGVLHTTGGYLVYASMTHQYVFDYTTGDVYWCTADVGWVTGHSYIVYGPARQRRDHADVRGRAELSVVSALLGGRRQAQGQHLLHRADGHPRPDGRRRRAREEDLSRKSLRLLGSVGEPINPEAWEWYYNVVGDKRCPIVDTWWQTETGGILITPLPGATDLKPGSATRPFFGVQPELVDNEGKAAGGCRRRQSLHHRLVAGPDAHRLWRPRALRQTYFSTYKGKYFTGDGCRRDEDGYYWITGRVDDVINVSGHRMGTAEVESALVAHDKVSEAAVVGYPHDIKGQGIYCYVTLMSGRRADRGAAQGARHPCAQGDRPDRLARQDPVRAGPAKDPLRQDHAPHPAQDRRGRFRSARRHLDAGRPGRGR